MSTDQIEKSVGQVQQAVLAAMQEIEGEESESLQRSLGRVLAHDLVSPMNVPAHDNSAMDGYAIRGQDYLAGIRDYKVVGKALAGLPCQLIPSTQEAIKVTTGAVMPQGCDTVIVQEACEIRGHWLRVPEAQVQGQNRRFAGEDLKEGTAALGKGRVLTPSDLGLVASLGFAQVQLKRRLKVAFFSSGDEVRTPGESLSPGQIFDSNRFTLIGLLTRMGFELVDLGLVKDSTSALEQMIRLAASQADAIISSGGVSVGEADYTKTVMAKLGEVEFWRIAMRPGRPMAFGSVLGKPYFGLPGNPVAVMVTFYFFARQALYALAGAKPPYLPHFKAKLAAPIRKKKGRTEYQRATLSTNMDGELVATLTGQQGSGVLSSMSLADCFVIMGDEEESAQAGTWVTCVAFHGLI